MTDHVGFRARLLKGRLAFLTMLVAACAFGKVAKAGDDEDPRLLPSDHSSSEAAKSFAKGKELAKTGKLAEARVEFFRAEWCDPRPDYAANLGTVELALKRYRNAAEHLAEALKGFDADEMAARRQEVALNLDEARKELGALRIHVERGNLSDLAICFEPPGKRRWCAARLSNEELLYVEPGHVVMSVRSENASGQVELDIAKGAPQDVTPALKPFPMGIATPGSPRGSSAREDGGVVKVRNGMMIGFGVLAAAGVAVGVAGVVLAKGVAPDDNRPAYPEMAAVGFGGAALALFGLPMTYYFAENYRAHPTRVQMVPVVAPNHAGLAAFGSF